ncbi:MAG: transporter [Betaproteobacteria bacterium]|nr:transporter [Betaproteobacteria bacterium]
MSSGIHLRAALLAACTFTVGIASAAERAGEWPTKPVRLIVPFAPGGATDIVARILAQGLADALGQQFVVDNRSGASGNIGVEMAVRAPADGYTVVINNVSTGAINPIAFASTLKYDSTKELTGVALLASIPNLLVSASNFPPNNLKELIDYAKARPGQLNYSNPIGAYSHLDMLEFMSKAGIQMVNVPSKGAGSSFAPVIAGEIHFSFLNAATVTPQVKAGRMKAFVTTAKKRLSELPDVPTMAEAGFPGMGSVNWNGFFVPAKTPRAIVDKLASATLQVLQKPAVQEAFAKAGVPLTPSASPEEFQEFVRAEQKRWARIIKENNVKFD